jgi:hypothetical protein
MLGTKVGAIAEETLIKVRNLDAIWEAEFVVL